MISPPESSTLKSLNGELPPSDLRAALFRLDLRLRMAVDGFRGDLAERAKDPFRGLYISDADIDELLASTPAADLAERLVSEEIGPVPSRLRRLCDLFELDADVFAVAADLDVLTGIAVAFPRSPMVTAATAWELAEASGGRFRLGLGAQVRAHIERRYGSDFDPPGPRMREYVLAVKQIFEAFRTGEPLAVEGDYTITNAFLCRTDAGLRKIEERLVWEALKAGLYREAKRRGGVRPVPAG